MPINCLTSNITCDTLQLATIITYKELDMEKILARLNDTPVLIGGKTPPDVFFYAPE